MESRSGKKAVGTRGQIGIALVLALAVCSGLLSIGSSIVQLSVEGTVKTALESMNERISFVEGGKAVAVEEQVIGQSGKVYKVRTEREKVNGEWESFDSWYERHAASVAYWAAK